MQEYFIILFPAFMLGILHTALPCEDKAIFLFWSFGISKNPKISVLILALYGFGLMGANMVIGIISVSLSIIPLIFGFIPDPYTINFFGAFTSSFAAIFMLFYVTRKDYSPHSKSKYKDSILNFNWQKFRTPFIFGFVAGFAPCIFELIIYSQCLQFAISYSILEGILIAFYFSLGTFIGLFPLALAKHGTSHIVKPTEKKGNRTITIMIFIIIIFNVIIMLLSFLRIDVFPVPPSS